MEEVEHDGPDLDHLAQASAVTGSLLFHLALAEALTGDALAGRFDGEPVGWAVDVTAEGYEVTAIDLEPPEVRARVTFAADGAPIVELRRAGRARPRQVALARARAIGGAHAATLGGRWLVLPIPPAQDASLDPVVETYLIKLADRPTDLASGPHWRLKVSTDAQTVSSAEHACNFDAVVSDAAGSGPPLIVLVHDDDVPSPIHVMLSLQLGVLLEVRTPRPGLRWRVKGETVQRLAI